MICAAAEATAATEVATKIAAKPTTVQPTMVMPALVSQDEVATLQSQADKCHAFADSKMPPMPPSAPHCCVSIG